MNKTIRDREPLRRWRGTIRGAVMILAAVGAVGCYDGTDGIPQLDVRPLSDAAASEGGGDGPRGDGGDTRNDAAATEVGDAHDAADAEDTAPDAGSPDANADSAPSPDDGAAG